MMEVIADIKQIYREDIRKLYISTFSKGDNAQRIDIAKLEESLNYTYQTGFMLVGLLSGIPVSALFVVPLDYDTDCPDEIRAHFDVVNSPYIAELMVNESYHGKGFGRFILEKSVDMLKQKGFSDVFIRVWELNQRALQLYLKAGFAPVARITQQKLLPGGIDTLEMNKVYLHKKL